MANLIEILPKGKWVTFTDLHPDTSKEDIQALFNSRFGVEIPPDRINISEPAQGMRSVRAIVSLSGEHFADIMEWALSEDLIFDRPLKVSRHNL